MLPLLSLLVSWLLLQVPWDCSSWFDPLDGVFVSTLNAKHTDYVTLNLKLRKVEFDLFS